MLFTFLEWPSLFLYSMNLHCITVQCTAQAGYRRGNFIGKDDSCDCTLAICMNYLSMVVTGGGGGGGMTGRLGR